MSLVTATTSTTGSMKHDRVCVASIGKYKAAPHESMEDNRAQGNRVGGTVLGRGEQARIEALSVRRRESETPQHYTRGSECKGDLSNMHTALACLLGAKHTWVVNLVFHTITWAVSFYALN